MADLSNESDNFQKFIQKGQSLDHKKRASKKCFFAKRILWILFKIVKNFVIFINTMNCPHFHYHQKCPEMGFHWVDQREP